LERLWHIGEGLSFLVAPAGRLTSHKGGAPVYLLGLYGKFRLRVEEGEWHSCRAAVIPPGLRHELDFGGEPVAALYLEPQTGGIETLARLLPGSRDLGGARIGNGGNISFLRTLYETRPEELGAALADLIGYSRRLALPDGSDPRLNRIFEYLHLHAGELAPAAHIAESVRLSSSRLQHLFTQHAGVPFRYYRAWTRLRAAMREIAKGTTFTSAAHESGYVDSAHFAHDFRRMFGSTATLTLRPHLPVRRSGNPPVARAVCPVRSAAARKIP